MKDLAKLKEAFKKEVGTDSQKEAMELYPQFVTENSLNRFNRVCKVQGPLLAFKKFYRAAISTKIHLRAAVTTCNFSGQMFNCTHRTEPETLTYSAVAERQPGLSGVSLVSCTLNERSNMQVEYY